MFVFECIFHCIVMYFIYFRDDEFRICFKVTVDGEEQQARNVGLPPFEEYEKEMDKVRINLLLISCIIHIFY